MGTESLLRRNVQDSSVQDEGFCERSPGCETFLLVWLPERPLHYMKKMFPRGVENLSHQVEALMRQNHNSECEKSVSVYLSEGPSL